ncbi:MAG TPA: peptidoglycan-binding protein, partial [Gemmatimonadaceae bacterium]|nr:peptidoglycan-binding protein [Gemmatimonadaceae bacterium]
MRLAPVAILLLLPTLRVVAQPTPPDTALVREAVDGVAVPAWSGMMRVDRTALRRLYARVGYRPVWTVAGRPTRQARQVIDVLAGAETRGQQPAAYDAAALQARADALAGGRSVPASTVASFDVTLSTTLMRLLAALHAGRVDPRTLGFRLPDAHAHVDLAALVLDVSRAPDVAVAIAAVEPPFPGYVALTRALARYRTLAADAALRPPRPAARTLRPGDAYADAAALRRLLAALGDLPAGDRRVGGRLVGDVAAGQAAPDAADTVYDSTLVAAVASFQRRHGLVPDSVVGPATMAQLRVPLTNRVEQIALTLERWRWLPDVPPDRYLVVNIPAFELRYFDSGPAGACPTFATRVIVGQAEGRHDTPVFVGTMRQVVFRPYWDVPLSIARKELLPKIRRDRSYLAREALEIVRGGDDDAVVHAPTAANLDRVAAGTLRLRQRPGPRNALGLV